MDLFKIQIYDTLDSTNLLAKQKIIANDINPDYINAYLALSQNAGVGKQGRVWDSKQGNLHLTFVLKIKNYLSTLDAVGLISLLSSVVIKETIEKLLISHNINNNLANIKLKWPNDVLIDEKKIAGILLEIEQNSNTEPYLIIGIGLNLLHYPQNLNATSLNDIYNVIITPIEFAQEYLKIFINKLNSYLKPDNTLINIRNQWLEHAFGLNKMVKITNNNNDLIGIFSNLNAMGHMVLTDKDNKEIIISTRDVFNLHTNK